MESIQFKLEEFEGPLDLLLYLVSKNKMNIYDIEIVSLIDQYVSIVNDA
ncbi:MAG: segregation/condensation protein A, partial [Oscillospiraceae bacterium]